MKTEMSVASHTPTGFGVRSLPRHSAGPGATAGSSGAIAFTPHSALRTPNSKSAFTLVELLVVITIIGILAGLIVTTAGMAMAKARRKLVETQRDQLVTVIDSYYAKKNFFPPDNTNSSIINPLYYELTGLSISNNAGQPVFRAINQEVFASSDVLAIFNLGGFINASSDPSEVQNYYKAGLKVSQYRQFSGKVPFSLLGVLVPGPEITNGITPWHYISSHPTNNVDRYDLWMDIKIRSHVYRISNWSKEPQVLD